jgi:hypothetical protein
MLNHPNLTVALTLAIGGIIASPAAVASTEAHITYAAVDAWDPVVLLDIGTRNVNETRGDVWAYDGSALDANLSDANAATLLAHAQASVGALHVYSQTLFGTNSLPGDLRSANFNAYAQWSDSLTAKFTPYGAQSGYAYFDLLVSGPAVAGAASFTSTDLPFARTYAGISVYGDNGVDAIRTTIVQLDNINYVYRQYIDDPDFVGDTAHFDRYVGLYFNESPPITSFAKLKFEGGSDYFPDPSTVSGAAFTTLAGTYQVRVPFTAGLTTNLDVRLKCESYGGAAPGDFAGSVCDLAHSVYWGGINEFTDLDGNVLTGVALKSASGFDYGQSWFDQPGPGVPEPASWTLMIAGFFLAGCAQRSSYDRAGSTCGTSSWNRLRLNT